MKTKPQTQIQPKIGRQLRYQLGRKFYDRLWHQLSVNLSDPTRTPLHSDIWNRLYEQARL